MLEKLFISLICFTKCSEATYRVVFFNILFIELFREGFYVSSLVYQDLNVRNRGRYKEGETWRLTETCPRRRLGLGVRRSRCLWVIKIRDDPFSDPLRKGSEPCIHYHGN